MKLDVILLLPQRSAITEILLKKIHDSITDPLYLTIFNNVVVTLRIFYRLESKLLAKESIFSCLPKEVCLLLSWYDPIR